MSEGEILLVDKPVGWTSFDVVAKIRGMIRADYQSHGIKPTKRQLKVGHAGTLDPFATGLLIILIGDATKKAGEFLKHDKIYETTIKLGTTSSTGDPEGELTAVSDTVPTQNRVLEALNGLVGEITQVPPAFSAIKIDGKRAYDLARQGKSVDIPPRQVTIYSIDLIDYTYPELRIRTHVSSGTYIRTLAADIGEVLNTGAYCQELRRTQIGAYAIENATTLDSLDITALLRYN